MTRDAVYPTGVVEVALSDDGVPEYRIAEDVAWDRSEGVV